ncbi:SMR family transporter [Campylobacter porcelli]|uniref:Multidrug efflux system protein, EmrE family n=1 Tax=Campylobacter porcelli TaxID=1660073 RepID=A0A1X9SVJ4_9BACT|nr:SMR family transporter [Campylobacter sp. RM6137]ARR00270.1 multidrug efflux system protein, EmrE family [Campylobacter sp. RM6137]
MSNKGFFWVIVGATFEASWAYGLKYANAPLEWIATAILVCCSFLSFMLSFKYLSVSVAYTMFIGFGTIFIVGAEIITNYFNNDSISFLRILFILLIIIGVLGLKRSQA